MPERPIVDPEPQYSETTDPKNPPNSVLEPAARRSAVWTYVGGIAAVFLVVAAVFAYWSITDRGGDSELDVSEPSSIGTAGDREPEDSPGGFNPAPDPDDTADELESKGAGERPKGPMPGLASAEPLTELGAMDEASPQTVAGRRIDLREVAVESIAGNVFVVQDGGAKASVIAPGGGPAVRVGQRVDISGTVEPDGQGGSRIRATRVTTR